MDLGQLEKLRLMNQDLLQRLKANQEAFRKQLPGKSPCPSLQSKRESPGDRQAPDPASEPTTSYQEEEQEMPRPGHWDPEPKRTEKTSVPQASEGQFARAVGKMVKKCNSLGDPENKSIPTSQTDSEMHPAHLQRSPAEAKPNYGQAKGSRGPRALARMPQAPKSILLTPQCKETKVKAKKEAGRVTFMSDPEEHPLPADEWSVRPFLGYDWIAGLLDMDSSVSEKPEQYFSELQDFRRVNRDACIHDGCLRRSEALGSSVLDQELDTESTSHQCVFCYRLNKRLFAVPVGSEAACPICKTLRMQQPPETLVEPAFVRVSVPRSTLLPAYKHKIHRRKSYEPADDLALPSHCLAGWENPSQALSPTLSSLDLRTTLAAETSGRLDWFQNLVSRVSGGTKTDSLLNLSRVTAFERDNVSCLWRHRKLPSHAAPFS